MTESNENQLVMDFESEAEAEAEASTDGKELSHIASLVDDLTDARRRVDNIEDALKEATTDRDRLSSVDVPEAMAEVGMSELRLIDGRAVRIKSGIRASIPKKTQHEAFNWLAENGFGDLIKAEMSVKSGRGEIQALSHLASQISDGGQWSPSLKEAVHPQTLSAFVREQRAEGRNLPDDLLGVFEYSETLVGQ